MKTIQKLCSVLLVTLIASVFLSCEKPHIINPFRKCSIERDLIVVISDMHLGADLAYAECKKNLPALEEFLTQIRESANVKELVIAGDLLDEWFVPAPVNTYQGKDQADFVKRIAEANKGVFDVLKKIIREKKILVTYVPGNHDLTITEENVDLILPGINQKRDPELGLGTYSPVGYPKIVIEHGHRYNFFCSPDPYSNQDVAPGTILPPGYFFTRIAAQYVAQGHPSVEIVLPPVTPNTSGVESQNLLYAYWKMWEWTLTNFTIEDEFDEDIIVT
ncbi:MAG: metallophosphoesterase, partial [Bacteroidales bacterium]